MLDILFAAALALSTPAPADEPAATSPARVEILPPDRIMALPPELRMRLQTEVLKDDPAPLTRLYRLLRFIGDKQGLGMAYAGNATHTVGQAYATRSGNCVSLTLLFLALAREAGLDAFPQEIQQTLSWHEDGSVFYRSNHVNAGVRLATRAYVVDFAGSSVIALQAPAPIGDQRLMAYFYNNLAMQDMELGNLASATTYMQAALDLDPLHAPHWSNAGVLHLRKGDLAAAENDYDKALSLDPVHSGALSNMAGLLMRKGDHMREAEFRQRLGRAQQADPLHHFLQALNFERTGDYANAIAHYQRAIELHGDEHRFHSALARAYQLSGATRLAIKSLARAHSLSDGSIRDGYKAQLDGLRKAMN